MTNLTHLPTSELITLAEKWIEQLEYSKGNHWTLRTVAGDTAPRDVFRELVERVKESRTWIEGLPPIVYKSGGVGMSNRVLIQDVNDNIFVGVRKRSGDGHDFIMIDKTDRTSRVSDVVCYQPLPPLYEIIPAS